MGRIVSITVSHTFTSQIVLDYLIIEFWTFSCGSCYENNLTFSS